MCLHICVCAGWRGEGWVGDPGGSVSLKAPPLCSVVSVFSCKNPHLNRGFQGPKCWETAALPLSSYILGQSQLIRECSYLRNRAVLIDLTLLLPPGGHSSSLRCFILEMLLVTLSSNNTVSPFGNAQGERHLFLVSVLGNVVLLRTFFCLSFCFIFILLCHLS